jgi:hypothetical protein
MNVLATLLPLLRKLHEIIRDGVVDACERSATETLAAVAREQEGDMIYAVDRVGEDLLVEFFEREIAPPGRGAVDRIHNDAEGCFGFRNAARQNNLSLWQTFSN